MAGKVTVATLEAKLTANTRDFNKKMKGVDKRLGKTDKSLKKMNKTLGGFGAALGGAVVLGAISKTISAASDLEESINAVEVVFGDAAKEILAFTADTEDAVFATASSLNELATVTGSLLQNFGFSAKQAATKTGTVSLRAADMASVFNVDVSDALMSINAAVRGETESIRRFGVNVDETATKAKALELGLIGVGEALTQEAKVAARVAIIMEQTEKVHGDAAATADSFANQQRKLNEQFEVAKVQVGQKLMPAMQDLLSIAIDLAPVIGDIATQVANLASFAGKAIDIVFSIVGKDESGVIGLATLAGLLKFGVSKATLQVAVAAQPDVITDPVLIALLDERLAARQGQRSGREFFDQWIRQAANLDFRQNDFGGPGLGAFVSADREIIVNPVMSRNAQKSLEDELATVMAGLKASAKVRAAAEQVMKQLAATFGSAFADNFKKNEDIGKAIEAAIVAVQQQQQINALVAEIGEQLPADLIEGIVAGLPPGGAITALSGLLANPEEMERIARAIGFDIPGLAASSMLANAGVFVSAGALVGNAMGNAANAAFLQAFNPSAGGVANLNQMTQSALQASGIGGFRGFPTMHGGGIVPGVPGSDVPILAQAGERVTPAGGGGGVVVNIFGDVSGDEVIEKVRRGLRTDTIRGGSMEFS